MKKTVLITGGSRGIGKATAELFCQKGYNVAFTYLTSIDSAAKLEKSLNEKGTAAAYLCDVSDYMQVEGLVKKVAEKFGKIDAAVINAGVAKQNMLADVTSGEFDFLVNTNLRGAFNTAKAATKSMMWGRGGSIVFLSSVLGSDGCSCESVYSLTKGGINAFALSLAKELGGRGITVNAVCPGFIDTNMNDNLTREEKLAIAQSVPLGRLGTPEDVANAVLFLAESPYVTGHLLTVAGGAIF